MIATINQSAQSTATSSGLLGHSLEIKALLERLPILAAARRTTLITGPTGSGKEVVASELHRASGRGPLVNVHCGALPEQLAESELFGHARGAFTGAHSARPGLIRSASGGTLFLDEIDSLSLGVQAKLLRFLETGEYRAVGSDVPERAEVWVLTATNANLRERIRQGAFREDLLYRIEVMHLRLPALRDREDDITLLAHHFLAQSGTVRHGFTEAAMAALHRHSWPGNVRELRHRVERAAWLSKDVDIGEEDLELGATEPARTAEFVDNHVHRALWELVDRDGLTLTEAVAMCERVLIEGALRAEGDNRTRAAQRLGIHVRTIFKKLQR